MDRRRLLAALPVAAFGSKAFAAQAADPMSGASMMADVAAYTALGNHRSGGLADLATSSYIAARWRSLGYLVEQPSFLIPNSETTAAQLDVDAQPLIGFAQPPMAFTPPGGVSAPLVRWAPGTDVAGKIVLIHLPAIPEGAARTAAYNEAANGARTGKAAAIVSLNISPSGEVVAVNTAPAARFDLPVLSLGEKYKDRLDAVIAGKTPVRLRIEGPGGTRRALNTIARLGDYGRVLIISTPQSGWFTCGGERGPGLALSLALSAWARRANLPCRLLFIATSGHEWIDEGARNFHQAAPKPADTAFWLHLGASFGAREFTGAGAALTPLDTPNLTRTLMVTPNLIDLAKEAFAGQPTIENPLPASILRSAGEFTHVLEAGHTTAAGFWGGFPLFHTPRDAANSTTPEIMETLGRSLQRVIIQAVTMTPETLGQGAVISYSNDRLRGMT